MNYLSFQAIQYRAEFINTVKELSLSLNSAQDEMAKNALEMLTAMQSSIEVMARADIDQQSKTADSLAAEDITQIGDYALTLLEEISNIAANRGLQETMMSLHRLSLPIAIWIATHQGRISKLEILVNAIATFANELKQDQQLIELCEAIKTIESAVAEEIRKDLEATNPMRPWRILNLNWGIVATRSHKPELMEDVFDKLIKNIPDDARNFFHEGLQQMDAIAYPDHARAIMEKYSKLLGIDENFH